MAVYIHTKKGCVILCCKSVLTIQVYPIDKVRNICVMFFLFQRLDLDSGGKQYFVVIFYGRPLKYAKCLVSLKGFMTILRELILKSASH